MVWRMQATEFESALAAYESGEPARCNCASLFGGGGVVFLSFLLYIGPKPLNQIESARVVRLRRAKGANEATAVGRPGCGLSTLNLRTADSAHALSTLQVGGTVRSIPARRSPPQVRGRFKSRVSGPSASSAGVAQAGVRRRAKRT